MATGTCRAGIAQPGGLTREGQGQLHFAFRGSCVRSLPFLLCKGLAADQPVVQGAGWWQGRTGPVAGKERGAQGRGK